MEQSQHGRRRIAFFGGSFDPPHQGHLSVARAARLALSLDTVLFAPVGTQPLKPFGATADFDDRVAMTRLAIAGETGMEVSLADAPKREGEPNYTLETLLKLRAELAPESQLFCLMGADSFLGLRDWHRGAEIPFAAPLVVASRPGQPLDDLRTALPKGVTMDEAVDERKVVQGGLGAPIEAWTGCLRNQAGGSSPFYLLPGLHFDVSATELRNAIRARGAEKGSSIAQSPDPTDQLLPAGVLAYIRSHGLYQ